MERYGILLIDDETAYHAIVAALLEPRGVTVRRAADADAALAAVRGEPAAMILLEVHLGADYGRERVASLRRVPWVAECPVIAFTTMQPADGDRYFRDRGFDGWFHKPFRAAGLLALAGRWLGTDLSGALPDEGESPLSRLLGAEAAAAMVARLHDHLREAVAAIDDGADPAPIGHRVGGLAGTLGFPMLSTAWLSLQDSAAAWPTVRSLTIEALGRA